MQSMNYEETAIHYYIIPDDMRDGDELYEMISCLNFTQAMECWNKLRMLPYNQEDSSNVEELPRPRLCLGVSWQIEDKDGVFDIIQVRGGKNYLCVDLEEEEFTNPCILCAICKVQSEIECNFVLKKQDATSKPVRYELYAAIFDLLSNSNDMEIYFWDGESFYNDTELDAKIQKICEVCNN